MKRSSSNRILLTLLGLTTTVGCGDDIPATGESGSGTDTGTPTTTGVDPTTTGVTTGADTTAAESGSSGAPGSSSGDPDSSGSSGPPLPPPMEADFVVTIENVSNTGLMFSPISPGLWANHAAG
nr:hypothetical protein [Deltaproteobacteria bacterium]